MKKRVLAVMLLIAIAVVGCGKVDEEITSNTFDKTKDIAAETEIIDEEDAVSQEEDEGTQEETATEVVEESTAETVPTEQTQPEKTQKTETKKTQTKTETPAVTTPVVSETVAITPEVKECTHQWKLEETTYEFSKTYTNGCNGCGYPLYQITEEGVKPLENLYFHPPYETERYEEPCCGGGFHNESLTSGRCYFCGGGVVYRQCMWKEMGKRCSQNYALGEYEKVEFDQNHFMYLNSCDCGKNWIIIGGEDGKGLVFVREYCTVCGEEKKPE